MGNHQDVARRWVARALGDTRGPIKGRNLHDVGDAINSYGSHFEAARILRDKKREPVTFLLNGDLFSVTTSRHQREIAAAVQGRGVPVVTIPFTALDAADIDRTTVQVVDVQRDWNTTTRIVKAERPGAIKRDTRYEEGGWSNSLTGEFIKSEGYSGTVPVIECTHGLKQPTYSGLVEWSEYQAAVEKYQEHMRALHGEWERVSGRYINTGRVRIFSSSHVEWGIEDAPEAPTGVVYTREVFRHWLGASLVRAQVIYRVNQRHAACGGTGQVEPWFTVNHRERGIGPLTEDMAARNEHHTRWMNERRARDIKLNETAIIKRDPDPEYLPEWAVDIAERHTSCRGCSGRGTMPATKRRWAFFLSGFDENETRPSYFFCELPPKARPATVEEAYEALKPGAVKLAESMGREVKRQGDIFFTKMATLTLVELKKQGGVHIKRPKLVDVDGRTEWSGPRPTLINTNHEATEIVLLDGQTYARGTITHNPANRRPDHVRLTLGKDAWWMVQKNTVPIGV